MTDKKMTGREIFEEAMKQYDKTYCDEFPPIEAELQFDEECEKNLRKLVRRLNNPFRNYFNTAGRRAAGIAAAILVFFGCSMTVSAVHKPVVEFFTNAYEKLVEFFFDDKSIANAPATIETVYTLGYVPEGYELVDFCQYSKKVHSEWRNNDSRLNLIQFTLNGEYSFDNEYSDYYIMAYDNFHIACIEKYDTKKMFWNNSEYAFELTVPSTFTEEECLLIIDSIIKSSEKGGIKNDETYLFNAVGCVDCG